MLVDAKSKEFNYQTPGKTDQFTRYQGKDGVPLSNIVRRAAFALRFGSLDPLISGQVTSKTKVLMERDIRARVEKLAPFLKYDGDPYPVAMGNHTLWVLDGYTTTSMYPYSQSTSGEQGLASDFNYVRNSVKATVDAYDGTVTFYVFDPKDPIIQAWRKAFPDLFTDASHMSPELRAHLRYPEDLFKVQSNQFGRYHVTEPRRFYDGSAKWLVSPDPGSGAGVDHRLRRPDRRRQLGHERQRAAAGGHVDRASASIPTTSTSSSRRKTRSTSSSSRRSCRCRREQP